MKNKDEYTDQTIEQLLKNAPEIKDSRSKEDILMRLKNDSRLSDASVETQKPVAPAEKRKKKPVWVPTIVSVVAVALLIVLLPPMFKDNPLQEMSRNDSSMEDKSEAEQSAQNIERGDTFEQLTPRTSLYAEEVGGNSVLHLGLVSSDGVSVPVTFMIPREKIVADFGNTKPTSYDLYMKYAQQIDEEALGFIDYHPYQGEQEVIGEQIIFKMPEQSPYDGSSAQYVTFTNSLLETFYGFKDIIFKAQNESQYVFSEMGEPIELEIRPFAQTQFGYFVYKDNRGVEYLSPNNHSRFNTVQEAMEALSVTDNDIYASAIPTGLEYVVTVKDSIVTITFNEMLDVDSLEPSKVMKMIEAFALTAASFNHQVQLSNVQQTVWEEIELSLPIPMPVGPNLIQWDFSE